MRIKGECLAYLECLGKNYSTKGGISGAEEKSSGLMGIRRPGLESQPLGSETVICHMTPLNLTLFCKTGWRCPVTGFVERIRLKLYK